MFRTFFITSTAVIVVWCSSPLVAQSGSNSIPESKSEAIQDSTWGDWNFRVAPYVWLLGIKGQLGVRPSPGQLPYLPPLAVQLPNGYSIYDIDLNFKEVRNSLKFAIMLAGQYKHERFITQLNISSLVLESNAIAPFDYVFKDNTLRLAYVGGDLGAGYRVVRNKRLEFDLLLGLKFVYFKVGLTTKIAGTIPLSGIVSNWWVDPVVGANFVYRPHKRIELVAIGDIGPTLLNEQFTYQFATNVNFIISRHLIVSAGYRNYYVESPIKEAIFTGTLSGMVVKFGVQF